MARELVQTRADGDTVEALEDFADESDITRSEAIRRLLRSGLAKQGHPVKAADGAGQLADELEAIKTEQREANRRQTRAAAAAVAYIAVTLALPPLGAAVTVGWAAVGLSLAAVVLITARDVWGDDS